MAERNRVMESLQAVLVTGFLGAGKTTLINGLLRYLGPKGLQAALLINDFGKINIDTELIDADHRQKVFEVNQGSIFCVCTRDQFFRALEKILDHQPPFDLLVIEATGIAHTGDLNEYLMESGVSQKIRVLENLCLIDACNFHKVFATLPAVRNQVEEATLLVVNKVGMAQEAGIDLKELERNLRDIHPQARILRTDFAAMDFDFLFQKRERPAWTARSGLQKEKPQAIYSVSLQSSGFIEKEDILRLIKDIESPLMRAKGFFESKDGPYYIEQVGEDVHIRPYEKEIGKNNKLVLIGGKMDEQGLQQAFGKITSP